MGKKTRSGVWRCRGGFAAPGGLMVPDGTLVPNELGYEVMDGRENLFEDVSQSRAVEQATAAPGEKRAVQPPTVEPDEADDEAELEALREVARDAGVKVDKRWGVDRLREEIAKAG